MDEQTARGAALGPGDYWRVGPVYVRKWLFLLTLAALSMGALLAFGLPVGLFRPLEPSPPAFSYDDPRLKEHSGLVRVLDAQGRVRYEGEVALGSCTGAGKVYDAAGQLVYDGPLVDGVYEGPEAKVYRNGVLVYTGEMAGGLYEGLGRRLSPESGVVSEGQFSKGRLEGAGREYAADGALLRQGIFSQDLLEGEGREYSPQGVLLREGSFSAGALHGDGAAYTASGALRYEGQFRRGVFWGQGKLYDTRLNALVFAGSFVDGAPMGSGSLYHPSGQVLYTGQVYGDSPRADAFLGLSLAEVEEAFAPHWLLYSCGGMTAFVYPAFQLMFLTESPVELVSPAEREDEVLAPDTDKSAITITQVLSYGRTLPGVPQPEVNAVSGRHAVGWREWFCAYAAGERPQGALVRQSGPFVYRFTPLLSAGGEMVEEFLAQGAGLETMAAARRDKGGTIWYQSARWKEEP